MASGRSAAATYVTRRLRALADPDRAKGEKAYLKSELRFYGVGIPEVRATARDWAKAHPEMTREGLLADAQSLLRSDYHDVRSVGIALLELRRALLETRDLPYLIEVVRLTANWAHVDWLAIKVIGDVLRREPASQSIVAQWASESLWVRRTALLGALDELKAGRGDFASFESLAVPMLEDEVFWIRKAIGWVLREVSKKRAELVRSFVSRHRAKMSGLTLREATKYLVD